MSTGLSPRGRICEAAIDELLERGFKRTSIERVLARAGVERPEFDRHFSDLQDCVVQVYRQYAEEFDALVFGAYEREDCWRDGLRAAAYAAARFLRENPRLVRFGVVEMPSAGLMAQAQRESHLQRIVELIDAGRGELSEPSSIGRGVAEGVCGAIHEFVVRQAQNGYGGEEIERFVPELMYLAVRPYLGHEAAREELTMPIPGPPARVHPSTENGQPPHAPSLPGYGPLVGRGDGEVVKGDVRLGRLPPGRHGLSRDFVTRNQRERLAAGTIAVVAERGLSDATVTRISAAAGVSRRTFYTYFSSKDDCYLATYQTIVDHLRLATDAAAAEAEDWPREVAAKLRATLEFLAANPDLARFCLIAPQRAGEAIAGRYRVAMDRVVAYLCEGKPPPPATRAPSEAVAASLVGGMVALVVRQVNAEEGDSLPSLLPDLLEIFLAPFLGREAAAGVARNLDTV